MNASAKTAKKHMAGETPTDSALTASVKAFAFKELNADLVGVADIGRFEHAPKRMSPQGIFPKARSVIVMAVHHPDAVIERDGLKHPQDYVSYGIQGTMNSMLDEMSYSMARFMEEQGCGAVPIVSSNIWRYRGYKELKEQFAPDLSHMHAAVAAGLAEFGYNGLAITPEFGARQRYVTIITDAELTPTPLLEPGSVCDNCMLCVKHCLSGALSREINGWNTVRIEDREYKYVRKNLWRCAWGEHFGVDLDLDKPDVVTEQVILDTIEKHGLRGGEMGSCLRHCVPKPLRYFDRTFTDAPRRKRAIATGPALNPRTLLDRVRARAAAHGVEFVLVHSNDELAELGIDTQEHLPGCVCAITVGVGKSEADKPGDDAFIRSHALEFACHDIARELERAGYDALPRPRIEEKIIADALAKAAGKHAPNIGRPVLTNAPLPMTSKTIPKPSPAPEHNPVQLTRRLCSLLNRLNTDMVGIAPAEVMDRTADSLASVYNGEESFDAKDRGHHFKVFDPELSPEKRMVTKPRDWLPGAKSVIIIGAALPMATVDNAIRTPSESVGTHAFAQYITAFLLRKKAWRVRRMLEQEGFRAACAFDLFQTGSFTNSPRGKIPDAFSNAFAAAAAGLGRISKGGFLVTSRFGANARFMAVVTDAELAADEVPAEAMPELLCSSCDRCRTSCPAQALGREEKADINGTEVRFMRIDRKRCDWAKRFSLLGESGTRYMGWNLDVPVPDDITAATLAEALRRQPPILRHHPCNLELCVLACPHARQQSNV